MAKTRVEIRRGHPVLVVDGKVQPPLILCYHTEHPSRALLDDPPVHIYTFMVSLEEVWKGIGSYDFTVIDQRAQRIERDDPAAHLFPRISLDAPSWWEELHPDHLNTYADVETDAAAMSRFRRVYGVDSQSVSQTDGQSFAAEVWKAETAETLTTMIRHIRASSCGGRFIGCHLAAGGGGEWFTRGLFENRFADYSRPMVEAFRKWLRRHYGDDAEALRIAWGDLGVDFDIAQIPSREARLAVDDFAFRDPRKSRPVVDYGICFSEVFADGITHFARVVKEVTHREWICGVFYGYLVYGGMFPYTLQNSGHRAIERVLHCPDVDLLAAPYSYNDRGLGGDSTPMSVVDSVHLHGKLWFNEDDNRTHLAGPEAGDFGRTNDLQGTLAVLQRSFAQTLTKGAGLWWFDMTGGWYDQPEIARCMRRMREIAELSNNPDRGHPSEEGLAVILDDSSPLYMTLGDRVIRPLITKQVSCELGRIGAPYHTYLVDDLADPAMPEYRCYLFLNTFHLTKAQRQVIDNRVRRDGKVAVWIYAPGFIEEELSVEGVSEITGIQVGVADVESDLHVHPVNFDHPITANLPRGLRFGTDNLIGPVFYGDDPSTTTLGMLTYLYTRTRPGLCLKSFTDWTSIYIAAPMVPACLLRGIVRFAGIHLYSEGDDVLYADGRFLTLHTRYPGRRWICLPRQCDVYDLFEGCSPRGEPLATGVWGFDVDLTAGVTKLYLLVETSNE